MSGFQLRFMPINGNETAHDTVPIEAGSPQEALKLAQERIGNRTAELLDGDRRLARIKNNGTAEAPIWHID